MRYLGIKAELQFDYEGSDVIECIHNIFKDAGLISLDENYAEYCATNQRCFNERVESKKHEHKRLFWESDWISFMGSFPIVRQEPGASSLIERKYTISRYEYILFPEEEAEKPENFERILKIVSELYKLNFIYSVTIQKEE